MALPTTSHATSASTGAMKHRGLDVACEARESMAHLATDRYLQVVEPTPVSSVADKAVTAVSVLGALFAGTFLLATGIAFFAVAFFASAFPVADVFALTAF